LPQCPVARTDRLYVHQAVRRRSVPRRRSA